MALWIDHAFLGTSTRTLAPVLGSGIVLRGEPLCCVTCYEHREPGVVADAASVVSMTTAFRVAPARSSDASACGPLQCLRSSERGVAIRFEKRAMGVDRHRLLSSEMGSASRAAVARDR